MKAVSDGMPVTNHELWSVYDVDTVPAASTKTHTQHMLEHNAHKPTDTQTQRTLRFGQRAPQQQKQQTHTQTRDASAKLHRRNTSAQLVQN